MNKLVITIEKIYKMICGWKINKKKPYLQRFNWFNCSLQILRNNSYYIFYLKLLFFYQMLYLHFVYFVLNE